MPDFFTPALVTMALVGSPQEIDLTTVSPESFQEEAFIFGDHTPTIVDAPRESDRDIEGESSVSDPRELLKRCVYRLRGIPKNRWAQWLGVSRQTFYKWIGDADSSQEMTQAECIERITRLHDVVDATSWGLSGPFTKASITKVMHGINGSVMDLLSRSEWDYDVIEEALLAARLETVKATRPTGVAVSYPDAQRNLATEWPSLLS